jgi:hypothetical protein
MKNVISSRWFGSFVIAGVFLQISIHAPYAEAHREGGPRERGPHEGRDVRRRRAPEHRRRDMVTHPRRIRSDDLEESIRELWQEEGQGARCEELGQLLVRLSHRILQTQSWVKNPERGYRRPPGWQRYPQREVREGLRRRWVSHLHSQAWWERFWISITDAYRACDVECFEDGQIVGQISALGYCSLSEGLGGLDSPGLLPQQPIPVCETATYAGCLRAYRQTAASTASCQAYMSGPYSQTFNSFLSQDCHID